MRKKIVAGNWKMNKTRNEAIALVNGIVEGVSKLKISENVQVILAPPFPFLESVFQLSKNSSRISVAAQNCHSEEKGAYTGEVAASMLESIGVSHVILGHSERRAYFNEDNNFLAKKVKAVLKNNLKPIFCCGEILAEREKGNHFNIVKTQLEEGLFVLNSEEIQNTIIAYEPVWAIGTGVTASSEQAQEMHAFIRGLIKEKYGDNIAGNYTILYGGSCNAKNARELFANTDVDGGLIGGASLIANDFITIVDSF
ncbi:MAG TPA: triose-phosphate isomerase [Bacteroidales bacterium]|nr:triose-phosphate isomerase [Bacteroidales bacterium]HPS17759.1 triose-phosphate isomerase [Bacteroidales bacterium]